MIIAIVTGYGEPKTTKRAIKCLLDDFSNLCTGLEEHESHEYKIVVADPFFETEEMVLNNFGDFISNRKLEYFQDEGFGKSYVLNQLIRKYDTGNINDIFIFTDGDVFIGEGAVKEILKPFEDIKVGIVCGHPVPLNHRNDKYGFFGHLAFEDMDDTRRLLSRYRDCFAVSGYLFAMRNGVVKEFYEMASEDNVLPLMFHSKGYKTAYSKDAVVYVLNPQNFKDWIIQKKRNIKGHIAAKEFEKSFAATWRVDKDIGRQMRENSFFGEVFRGVKALRYIRNSREFFWLMQLYFIRLYAWALAYYEAKIKKERYKDGWREFETKSTKIDDL